MEKEFKMIAFIDPGPEQSGWCVTDWELRIVGSGVLENFHMRDKLLHEWKPEGHYFGIERPVYYGFKGTSPEILPTCIWVGRFIESNGGNYEAPSRPDICEHLAGRRQATKSEVWRCLVEKFGGKGTKKDPGRLYGLASHARDAFAGCVYLHDKSAGSVTRDF